MKDLSMHILDICENSVRAGAVRIRIDVKESTIEDRLCIIIEDNGKGMSPEMLQSVKDPFLTSRTTRRVGLGIPFLVQNTRATGGDVTINSVEGAGTQLTAVFCRSHIDRPAWGDLAGTIRLMITGNPLLDIYYRHCLDGNCFEIGSPEIRENLEGGNFNDPGVSPMIKEIIHDNLVNIGVLTI